MNELNKIAKIAKVALDGYINYQTAKINKYQNIRHIMNEESETLIPSVEESYYFNKEIWNISEIDNYIVLKKRGLKG